MDQYLLIPFLVGWTSIYQLFWCSPGVQGFDTLPYIYMYSIFLKLWGYKNWESYSSWGDVHKSTVRTGCRLQFHKKIMESNHLQIPVVTQSLMHSLIWLVVSTTLKNMSSSVRMIIQLFPIYGKIKFLFQTTNQMIITNSRSPGKPSNIIKPTRLLKNLWNHQTAKTTNQ